MAASAGDSSLYRVYVYPLALFLGFNLLFAAANAALKWDHPEAAWWMRAPEMWVYPLQTLVCGWYLWHVRREIPRDGGWGSCCWGAFLGTVGIALWILPYAVGWIPAEGGFEPGRYFGAGSWPFYGEYAFRFCRAVVVVPLAEELFWRGFLMRWCIDRDFPQDVPIGTGSWLAWGVSTVAFMLAHAPGDYPAAFLYGTLAYGLVVWTKRLSPVIVMHAVANLIMGVCAVAFDMPQLW